MYRRSSTAHCPRTVEAVTKRSSTAPVRQCTRGDPLPTAPRQCGSAPQESHYLLPHGSGSEQQELHCGLPPGGVAVEPKIPTVHCPAQWTATARRQREGQPSATGAQHTRQSAHLDTQPCQLAFSCVQDHPGHCLLVTAPSRLPLPLPRPTHLRTARTQHTQPSPFTCTRG